MKKKWIIAAAVALALGALITVAVADHGGKRGDHGGAMARVLEHLDLTDEQKEQLRDLRQEHMGAMQAQRETMAAMRKEHREAVQEILTEEQQETMEEMRSRRGGFFREHGGWGKDRCEMRRGGKGAFSRLDLSDEQKEQLKELRQEHRAEMRETRKKHRTALENLLTPEQREKLEEMKDEAFYGGGKRWRGKR